MSRKGPGWLAGASMIALFAVPATAHAFCGFYVASADEGLVNEATMVVLMREGTKTVLSMQNDYRGPPEDFAMVVPVPVVLAEEDVRTLPDEVFERVDRLASPRLVEYWEQDPCGAGTIGLGVLGLIGRGAGGGGTGYGAAGLAQPSVTVEAEFEVGEYDIVILGARDSSALDAWLRARDYRIPDGAESVLRPYVAQGMKFFVAKVNTDRVPFEDGRTELSPLRFHYDDETFRLPVRLGLLNSAGTQDLVVHVLARNQRYEVANYDNVTIPTNLDVTEEVRDRFGAFYAALFDQTLERHPGAVVTEYAWQATGCDPCPGPVLSPSDLTTLGADVVLGGEERPPVDLETRVRVNARVRGSMPREIVRRIARRHSNEVRFCYDARRARFDGLEEGDVRLRFRLSPEGTVEDPTVVGGTLRDDTVRQCISTTVARWVFPRPEGEVPEVTLTHRFDRVRRRARGWSVGPFQRFVLTRLHYRYDRDHLGEDLVFRAAAPIVGGRERRGADGELEEGSQPATANNFQGRYAIRHAWEGPVTCDDPQRGIWGGRPAGRAVRDRDLPETRAATDVARAPRDGVDLASLLVHNVEALGLAGASRDPIERTTSTREASDDTAPPAVRRTSANLDAGCGGCSAGGAPSSAGPLVLVPLAWALRRRGRLARARRTSAARGQHTRASGAPMR